MIKLNVTIDDEDKVFEMPENWDEVTVGDFMDLFNINREGLSQYQSAVETLKIFTKMPEELIYMMSMSDFEQLAKVLEFVTKDVDGELAEYIELGGDKYYLKKDFSSLTMGEVISIETIVNDAGNNIFKVVDKLLCIFLRKKKENGNLEAFKGDFMNRVELFRTAPIGKVYNIFSFFSDGVNSFTNNTVDSLEEK